MATSRRNKILIGAGALVGLLIVALLVAPRLIDVNSYKPELVAAVKKATGRELVIDGPIHLTLLPWPEVGTTGVRFANATGAKGPQMVDVKSVSLSPALWPLLTGRIEVGELTLVEPKISLEPGSDGKPNWEFSPEGASNQAPGAPSKGFNVSVGRLAIENGTLAFFDPKNGIAITAQKLNIVASVGSAEGPFAAAGSAVLNGTPLKLDAKVNKQKGAGQYAEVMLETDGGSLTFKGTLSDPGPNANLLGNVSVRADSLTGFLAALLTAAGQEAPPWPPLLAGKFSFDGTIEKTPTTLAARDFKIAMGEDSGAGTLSLTLAPAIVLDAHLVLPKIDLDKWVAELANPTALAATAPALPKPGAPAPAALPIPADVTVNASVAVAEVLYNKASIQNVSLELDIRNGMVAVPRLSAVLPGDMVLQAQSDFAGSAARQRVEGEFSLVGPKLRDTLAWLKVDLTGVAPDRLTKFSLRGRMASNGPTNIDVNDAVFELDDLKGSAGIVATLGVPLSVVTRIGLDTVDVDSYLAQPAADQRSGAQPPAAASLPAAAAPSTVPPLAVGPLLGLKLKVAKLIYRKETFGGIDSDISVQGNVLTVNDLKVSDLLGGRAAVRGSVISFAAPVPRFEMAVNLDAPDADRLIKFAGAGAALKGKVGALTASGGIGGTRSNVALRDFTVTALGATMHATGTASVGGDQKFDFSHIGLQIQDPARLAAAVTGEAAGAGMGPLALNGALAGAPDHVTFKGSLQTKGDTIDAVIDAKLGDRPNITADLKAPGTLDIDRLSAGTAAPAVARTGPGRAAQPAAAAPADSTAAMRGLDASIKLTAGTLVLSPLRVANADVAATLKDGVVTLSHFKGRLYGGALDLSGTVNGSGAVPAFDIKGSATGISLGEMLRSTSGSNVFGGKLRATIDGTLNATGIAFKGAGATSAAIKSSLVGGMALSGNVSVGVDRAFLAMGSVASGAVGAADSVVDNTVGAVLSGVTGQRIALDLGADAGAIILVVNRFANRANPIGGRIDIASGTATANGLAVQGDRATAHVASRNNLLNSTTDTTVSFNVDGYAAPYLVTSVRGSTSQPSLGVSRGAGARSQPQSSGPSVPIPGVGRLPLPNLPGLFGR
jgi:uncharacterized protein involved in outer membrane biogenesis